MYIKKLILLMLALTIILVAIPASASGVTEMRITAAAPSGGGVMLSVSPGAGGYDRIDYMIHLDFTLVDEGSVPYAGSSSVLLPVPVNSLKSGDYKVTAWGSGGSGTGKMFTFEVIMGSGSGLLAVPGSYTGPAHERLKLRAIKTPYAIVYTDLSMSETNVQLQKHDRVFWYETTNPNIYRVEGYILPDEIELVMLPERSPTGKAYYTVSNTVEYWGYIYSSAIMSDNLYRPEEIAMEAAGLAHSRIGRHGIYSNSDRFGYIYVDCSSFVYWSYKEFGLDFGVTTAGYITEHLYSYKNSNPDVVVYNLIDDMEIIVDEEVYRNIDDEPVEAAVRYPTRDTVLLLELLEPGDILSFNYPNHLWYMGYPEEDDEESSGEDEDEDEDEEEPVKVRIELENTQALESLAGDYSMGDVMHGVDHLAIYIGNNKIIHTTGFITGVEEDDLDGVSTVKVHDLTEYHLNAVIFAGRPSALAT